VLSERSGVPIKTTEAFERGTTNPKMSGEHKWRRALERADVVFIEQDETGPWECGCARGQRRMRPLEASASARETTPLKIFTLRARCPPSEQLDIHHSRHEHW
jgi:hypothetical protein